VTVAAEVMALGVTAVFLGGGTKAAKKKKERKKENFFVKNFLFYLKRKLRYI